jgi:hypothetical protein
MDSPFGADQLLCFLNSSKQGNKSMHFGMEAHGDAPLLIALSLYSRLR